MASSTLVGYSSGEEDVEGTRRHLDANYDDVKMDMSSEEEDGGGESAMFASKQEYQEYKKQFSSSSKAVEKAEEPSEYGSGAIKKSDPPRAEKHDSRSGSSSEDSSQGYLEDLKRDQEKERRDEATKKRSKSPDDHRRHHHRHSKESSSSSRKNRHHHKDRHRTRSRSRERRRRSRSRSRDRHRGGHSTRDRNSRGSAASERQDTRNRKLQSLGLVNPGSGTSYESQLEKVKEITGVEVPKYYNPSVINPLRYAEQIKKRQMLWSKKPAKDQELAPEQQPAPIAPIAAAKVEEPANSAMTAASFNKWEATNFGNDKTNEKFRRLMGIKNAGSVQPPNSASAAPASHSSVSNQGSAKWFADQEEQYERARAITHTQRGLGLGFSGALGMDGSSANPSTGDKKLLSFVKK